MTTWLTITEAVEHVRAKDPRTIRAAIDAANCRRAGTASRFGWTRKKLTTG